MALLSLLCIFSTCRREMSKHRSGFLLTSLFTAFLRSCSSANLDSICCYMYKYIDCEQFLSVPHNSRGNTKIEGRCNERVGMQSSQLAVSCQLARCIYVSSTDSEEQKETARSLKNICLIVFIFAKLSISAAHGCLFLRPSNCLLPFRVTLAYPSTFAMS